MSSAAYKRAERAHLALLRAVKRARVNGIAVVKVVRGELERLRAAPSAKGEKG